MLCKPICREKLLHFFLRQKCVCVGGGGITHAVLFSLIYILGTFDYLSNFFKHVGLCVLVYYRRPLSMGSYGIPFRMKT